MIFTRFCATKI